MALMVTQIVTVALRDRRSRSRTLTANGILNSGLIENPPELRGPSVMP